MHILIVCTANQCRSPVAEAFLRRYLPRHGTMTVSSAGLMAGGYPVPDPGQQRMRARGFDLSGHVSRQVTPAIIESAGLIVGMSRRHVRSIVAEDRRARSRAFTLKDLVRHAEQAEYADAQPLHGLLQSFDSQRPTAGLLGRSRADDISDPMGRAPGVWDAVVAEIDDQVGRLARFLRQVESDSAA